MSAPARQLSLADCVAIGVNGIVGSGIYLLVADMAKVAGPASIVGTVLCGLLCVLIALCFAELGGMFEESGGAYLYAREAFGPYVGFAVGWMSMATGVLAFAAVAVGFASWLAPLWPGLETAVIHVGPVACSGKTVVAISLISVLGAVNFFGVKAGARTSDFLSIAKMAPLVLLAVVGLFWVKGSVLTRMVSVAAVPGAGASYVGAVSSSALLAVFMLSGFEFTAVPAGEAKEARRNVPLAILGSLAGATVLYAVLEVVAFSVHPDLANSTRPLVDVAGMIFGELAQPLYVVAALVSMAGFCAGSALVGPRYFTALAERGHLPGSLTRLSRFGTPKVAILTATLLAAALAGLGYQALVDVSNVALFAQYVPAALAVPILRRTQPERPRRYRLPLGPTIPLLAALGSCLLLYLGRPKVGEWVMAGEILVIGLAVWGLTALGRKTYAARSEGRV